jgi:hypothetical protein
MPPFASKRLTARSVADLVLVSAAMGTNLGDPVYYPILLSILSENEQGRPMWGKQGLSPPFFHSEIIVSKSPSMARQTQTTMFNPNG